MAAEPGNGSPRCGSRSPTQRVSAASRIAGLSPFAPESWCSYLSLFAELLGRAWVADHDVPYLTRSMSRVRGNGPGRAPGGSAHSCFGGPGARHRQPRPPDRFLLGTTSDGDDVDIWAVLSRRWYGQFNVKPRDSSRRYQKVRRARQQRLVVHVWRRRRYPRLRADRAAVRPADVPALERARGGSRARSGQGVTSTTWTTSSTAFVRHGQFVLIYPGEHTPIASASGSSRSVTGSRTGTSSTRPPALRPDMFGDPGDAGLFSTTSSGTILACTTGCAA